MLEVIKYEVKLSVLSPLRIGAAEDPLRGISNPVVRVGSELVIPGSSIKGAIRHILEGYFIKLYNELKDELKDENLKPCLAAARYSKFEKKLLDDGIYSRGGCSFADDKSVICPVCYFLGAQGLPGFVRIPFLYLDSKVVPEVLTGIAIDRQTKTARERAKYEYELIPRGCVFKGTIEIVRRDSILGWEFGRPRMFSVRGERNEDESKQFTPDKWLEGNAEMWNFGKLEEIFTSAVKSINKIGGFKSKGAGEVTIELIKVGG